MDGAAEPVWVFRLTSGLTARLIPLGLLLFALASVAYGALAGAIAGSPATPSVLALVVTLVAVIPLHEALHGVGFVVFGGRPRFGFAIKGGAPYAFATCPGKRFTKRQFLVIGSLPLIVIDAVALAVAGSTQLFVYGLLAFAFNTSAAVGDLWMLALVLQSSTSALFEDTGDLSMQAYLPAGESLARLPRGLDPRGWERLVSWAVAWCIAGGLAYLALTVVELSLARSLNGGAGGTLAIGGVALATATPGHARLLQPPVLVAAGVLGFLAPAAISRLRRRQGRRPSPS